jgi:PEP-CTERM/exosortase A-associated glycosyltransferase
VEYRKKLPMKILHVLNDSIPLISGYSTRARAIVTEQAKLGLKPVVVTSVRQGPCGKDLEQIDGIVYYRTPIPAVLQPLLRRIGPLGLVCEMLLLARRICGIIRTEAIDIVHAHSPVLCAFPAWAAARRFGLPFVYEIRAFWEDAAVDRGRTSERSLRYRLTRGIETAAIRLAHRVVVICEGLKQDIVGRHCIDPSHIHVLRNGVDIDRFVPRPKDGPLMVRLGLENTIVIGFVGTFYAFEGLWMLVDALDQIMDRRPDVRGLIVGYGQSEEGLRQRVMRTRHPDGFLLPGKIAHEQVGAYYSLIDICVYPRESRRITELVTPLKPLEAMAMEKIVIASDVGGLRELVVDGENGFLFRAGDVADLIRAIEAVIADRSNWEALGKAARGHVHATHTWATQCAKYLRVYDGLRQREDRHGR